MGNNARSRRAKPFANGGEMIAECSVPGEVDGAALAHDHITAPEGFIAVGNSAGGEMQRRDGVDGDFGQRQRFAPVEFMNRPDILGAQQPSEAGWNDVPRSTASCQTPQGGQVQMVIVVVAEEYGVDGREIVPGDSRLSAAVRTGPGYGAATFGPDGVRQDIRAPLLEEHCGVVHERSAQSAAIEALCRDGRHDIGDEIRRWLRTAGQLPAKEIEKPARLRRIRIVKVLSVKMLRKCLDQMFKWSAEAPLAW